MTAIARPGQTPGNELRNDNSAGSDSTGPGNEPHTRVSLPDVRDIGARLAVLACSILMGIAGYHAGALVEGRLSQRNYSMIPDSNVRVGYCMMSKLDYRTKVLIAEFSTHPPDNALFETVVVRMVSGDESARQAMRALALRDETRKLAIQAVNAVAQSCSYWNAPDAITREATGMVAHWLTYDTEYVKILADIRRRPRDAADVYLGMLAAGNAGAAPAPAARAAKTR